MTTTTSTTTRCDQCERAVPGPGEDFGWLRVPQAGNPMLPPHARLTGLDFCSWACLAAYATRRTGQQSAAIRIEALAEDDPRRGWFGVTTRVTRA